jgi:hypothetical protein
MDRKKPFGKQPINFATTWMRLNTNTWYWLGTKPKRANAESE